MSFEIILLSVALLIIAVLAGYALHLVRKVKVYKAEQESLAQKASEQADLKYKEQRNELIKDLRFLANSVLQEQCEITEGVLRVQYVIQSLEPEFWLSEQLQHIRKHYDSTCDMPILDAYKQLSKKEQMKLDKQRWKLEADAKTLIEEDLRRILKHTFS